LFATDGSRLFVADGRFLRQIDPQSGAPLGTLAGHCDDLSALALPESGTLLSASADQTVLEWDLQAVDAMGGGHPPEETGVPE
jgi:hypothetical protein